MGKGLKNAVLPLLCLIVVLLVSGTHLVTLPEIERHAAEKAQRLRSMVLEGVTGFELVEEDFVVDGVLGSEVYATPQGEAAITVEVTGYGGPLQVMVGFSSDGQVQGVQVLSSSQTPGIGTKTETQSYLEQFIGGNEAVQLGQNVDVLAGATISSTAMTQAVNGAREVFNQLQEVKR